MSAFKSLQNTFTISKIIQFSLAVTVGASSAVAPAALAQDTDQPPYTVRSTHVTFTVPPQAPKIYSAEETLAAANRPFNVENIFNHYMDMSGVRHLFRDAQWQMINTPEDTAFTRFFYGLDEVLGGLFGSIKQMHTYQLERFSRHAHTSYTRILRGNDKVYDRILTLAEEAALRMGFSTKAVKNIEIYFAAEPGQNAFTVSGNNDRLIIVVNNDLVNNMTEKQLQAIIYHELGHIRSLHSVKGIMHDLLMMLVLGTYAPSVVQNSFSGGAPNELSLMKMQEIKCSLEGSCSHHNHTAHLNTQMLYKDSLTQNQFMASINKGIATLMSLPPQAKGALTQEYLKLLINVLKAEKGSPITINFFQQLIRNNVISMPFEINPKQLAAHLNVALMAVSRAQERSCDSYATSNAKNEDVAAAIAKLIAYIPQNKDSKATKKAIEMIIQQVEEFHKRVEASGNKDISAEVGTTHPSPALRVVDILKIETYPEVVYFDKFLKLLFTEDLIAMNAQIEKSFAQPAQLLRADILKLLSKNLSAVKNINFDKYIQYATFNRAILLNTLNKLKASDYSAELAQAIAALEFDLNNPPALTLQLEATLVAELEKTKSPYAELRLEIIRKVMTSRDLKELNVLQVGARGKVPAKLAAAHARTTLPIAKDELPTHPGRAAICAQLLTAAAQKKPVVLPVEP